MSNSGRCLNSAIRGEVRQRISSDFAPDIYEYVGETSIHIGRVITEPPQTACFPNIPEVRVLDPVNFMEEVYGAFRNLDGWVVLEEATGIGTYRPKEPFSLRSTLPAELDGLMAR